MKSPIASSQQNSFATFRFRKRKIAFHHCHVKVPNCIPSHCLLVKRYLFCHIKKLNMQLFIAKSVRPSASAIYLANCNIRCNWRCRLLLLIFASSFRGLKARSRSCFTMHPLITHIKSFVLSVSRYEIRIFLMSDACILFFKSGILFVVSVFLLILER